MIILGSVLIGVVCIVIYSFLFYQYWHNINSVIRLHYRFSLIILKLASVLFLLYLIINPLFIWNVREKQSQDIAVIFDLSKSMIFHLNNNQIDYIAIQDKLNDWGNNNNLNISYHRLEKEITNLTSSDLLDNSIKIEQYTNYKGIPQFISINQPSQAILFTDGKSTIGKNINEIKFDRNISIHTIGVGPIVKEIDLSIYDVIIPESLFRMDSVIIKVKSKAVVDDHSQTKLSIINENGLEIYSTNVNYNKGDFLKEFVIKILADKLIGVNSVMIDPLDGESQIKNNTFSFLGKINSFENETLLISGALSLNSNIIKSFIEKIDNNKIHHFFRLDKTLWNAYPILSKINNLQMIVLDDFPVNQGDEKLLNDLILFSKTNAIPLIYIEGPKSNLLTAKMINKMFLPFVAELVDNDKGIGISDRSLWIDNLSIDIHQFPPQFREIKWISTDLDNNWISYEDDGVMIGNSGNYYLFSLPSLSESFYKSSNSSNIVEKVVQNFILHAFYSENGLLKINIDGNNFIKGEIAKMTVSSMKDSNLRKYLVHSIHDADTSVFECINYLIKNQIGCEYSLLKSGKYSFFAQAEFPSGRKLISPSEDIIVQDIDLEMNMPIQKQKELIDVADQTGGTYGSIDSLDIILSSIDITPLQLSKNKKFNGLSLHNYWWILIVLLSLEWYFRKKMGLL